MTATLQNANGVGFRVLADGAVSWAEDWVVLFDLARRGELGLSTKSYGPATYGHTELVAGPWINTVQVADTLFRLNAEVRS